MGNLVKIGVFYDGNFFAHVSNYYAYAHPRRARIDIEGLHEFIRYRVAEEEQTDYRYAQIIDAHYFRGRRSADEANLYGERIFDTVLMRAGVVTHYLPLTPRGEKGIDVWLALEAFESAMLKHYGVLVLIAGDGDYVPLCRKLAVAGTRVMLLGFDAKYVDWNGTERETRTSQTLLQAATYPIMISSIIDDRSKKNRTEIDNLFVQRASPLPPPNPLATTPGSLPGVAAAQSEPPHPANGAERPAAALDGADRAAAADGRLSGTIKLLKEGYGFIAPDHRGADIYFYHADLLNRDFAELQIGARVLYTAGTNERGPCAREIEAP